MKSWQFLVAILGLALWHFAEAATDSYCPLGWVARLGSTSCYKISGVSYGDEYPDAQLRCQSEGGSLLVVNDINERDWIVLKFSHIGWDDYDRVWIGLKWNVDAEKWVWEDGSDYIEDTFPWDFLAYPHPPASYNASATLSSNGYISTSGPHMYYLPAICERSISLPILCDVDNGWVQVSDVCIRAFSSERTWDDAREACQSFGGDLLSIGADQYKFIHASDLQDPLNGIYEHWVGLYESSNYIYEWVNGEEEAGDHWGISEPQGNLGFGAGYISSVVYYTDVQSETYPFICQKPHDQCLYGFEQQGSSCFAIGVTNAEPSSIHNWDTGEVYCEKFGGHLVSIENAEENQVITSNIVSGSTWIGLYDAGDGSGFKWSDGRTLAETGYSNWASAQTPSTHRCALLNSPAGTWELVDCNSISDISCEVGPNPNLQYLTHPIGYCPTSWQRLGDYCYFYSTELLDWREAEIWCGNYNGILANIMTEFENNVTRGVDGEDYWIGLHDRTTEGDWDWTKYDFNLNNMYDNWGPDEPGYSSLENCAAVGNDTMNWYADDCRVRKQFLCKAPATIQNEPPPQPTTTTPSATNCDQFWDEDILTGMCYRNLLNLELTWYEAERECQFHNAHLLGINDPSEQVFIESTVILYPEAFPNFWLGSFLPKETGWAWVDEKPFTYSNWYFEPTLYDDINCAYVRRSDGAWWDESCDVRHHIICEKPGKVSTTIPTTPVPPTGPPGGSCLAQWEDSFTGCFLFSTDKLIWGDAEAYCISLGGHLASVRNQYEQDFLKGKLASHVNTSYWLGMSDEAYPMWFTWNDGSYTTVTPWGYQMPRYSDTQQQCVQINGFTGQVGQWQNIDCISESNYICRKDYTLFEEVRRAIAPENKLQPNPPNCNTPPNFNNSVSNYWIIQEESWDSSQEVCAACGGNLAVVNDEMEYAFIKSNIGIVGGSFWLGLTYNKSRLEYSWINGDKVEFTFWGSDQPAPNSDLRCVATIKNQYWSAAYCSDNNDEDMVFKSLCERNTSAPTTPTTPPATTRPCPSGWLEDGEFCLLISSDKEPRAKASSICDKLNSTLASFHSVEETEIITNQVTSGDYWIGLEQNPQTPLFSERGFLWKDHSPVNFVQWAKDEPEGDSEKWKYIYWNLETGWKVEPQEKNKKIITYPICKGRKEFLDPAGLTPTKSTTTKSTTTKATTTKATTTAKTTTTKPTTTKATTTAKTTTTKPTTKPTTAGTTRSTVSTNSTSTSEETASTIDWHLPTGDDSSNGGIIAGVIIACLFGVLVGGLVVYYYRKNKYLRFGTSREDFRNDSSAL